MIENKVRNMQYIVIYTYKNYFISLIKIQLRIPT